MKTSCLPEQLALNIDQQTILLLPSASGVGFAPDVKLVGDADGSVIQHRANRGRRFAFKGGGEVDHDDRWRKSPTF